MSFETLGLSPELIRALAELGYTSPTPIQAEAIPLVMAGHDLMGGAQTGTGKTAAFSLPLLHRLAQAGRTFKYTDKGAVGLAGGKTVIVALSRGGVYSTSEGGRAMEHQESYLQTVLGFFGITDVRFVRAEGVAMGPDAKVKALATAESEIASHTAEAALA